MVLGSDFLFASQIQRSPTSAENAMTKTEFAVLFKTLGSIGMCNTVPCKLFSANRLKDPPLCSKNAQKTIEKKMKNKAARSL